VAYQSEIEFRVKVLDSELKELEKRLEKLQNPFAASGKRRPTAARAAGVRAQKEEADLIRRSIEDLDRLRETKAQKTQQTNIKRVRFLRDQRIRAARDVANAEKKFAADQLKRDKAAIASRQRLEKAAASGRSRKFQDIATGAGFPLLFGGGPIQALAGGLGGAAGGLGGAIAASAITAQVEAFAKEAAKVGQALNSTGGALELVREKSLFSTEQIKERAFQLEEQGRVEELAALLTDELTQLIGNEGVRSLQELGKTTSKTTKLWNELTTQLFALVSGPLDMFLKAVNDLLGRLTQGGKFSAFLGDLDPEQRSAAEARVEELQGRVGKGRSAAQNERMTLQAAQAQVLEEMGGLRQTTVSIPVTKQDRRDFSVSGGDKAAKDKARLDQKLAALEQERQKILEISAFKDKIAAAEAASDSQLVIRLQGEQRIAQIESKRLTDLTKVKDQRLIDAININAATEKLAAQRQTERDITEEQRQRQELFDTTIEGLEHQLLMTEATSQAERDRLKIARELKKLEDKGLKGDQLAQAGSIMEQLAVAQQPLNAFIRKATEDLNNLQQVAVDVSQGIGNAIGGSLVNGLQGLVTGATSVKQVFADMLRSIADVLAQQASQMIATYIAIGIARAFAGMGGGESTTPPSTMPGGASQTGLGLNINGVDQGINPFGPGSVAVASGGYISSPTRALVGEGGQGEYVIPESKMRESMTRYSRGARGSSVIPEAGGSGTSGEGGGTAVAAPIDVRYTVERINSVDYVTADQFQSGMQSAAAQGAQRGEQNTLKRLQMSGSTRRRLGM